jgi:hypothetical protein
MLQDQTVVSKMKVWTHQCSDERLGKQTRRRCDESLFVVVVERKETESPSHGSNDLYIL